MKKSTLFFLITIFFPFWVFAEKIIVIDPGHDPKFVGAIGRCGVAEYKYNDYFVDRLIKLNLNKINLVKTRGNNSFPTFLTEAQIANSAGSLTLLDSLKSRTDLANSLNASFFISVHHDSVSSKFITMQSDSCLEKSGKKINDSLKNKFKIGFNIFINKNSPFFNESLDFSKVLSDRLIKIGRTPSNYHFYPWDDCLSCSPIDESRGIWYQDLYVLRNVNMPAILIEIGNIIDVDDERIITTDIVIDAISQSILTSLADFLK
jgi:N-acetylmuramoyl-L-alanine amidase